MNGSFEMPVGCIFFFFCFFFGCLVEQFCSSLLLSGSQKGLAVLQKRRAGLGSNAVVHKLASVFLPVDPVGIGRQEELL